MSILDTTEIDEELVGVVTELNKLGFITNQSCAGHSYQKIGFNYNPYISFFYGILERRKKEDWNNLYHCLILDEILKNINNDNVIITMRFNTIDKKMSYRDNNFTNLEYDLCFMNFYKLNIANITDTEKGSKLFISRWKDIIKYYKANRKELDEKFIKS